MRILLLLSQPPAPEGGAAGRCAVATIRGLRAAGHDVHVLAPDPGPGDRPGMPADLDAELVAPTLLGPWATRARRVLRPRGRLGVGGFAARALELARDADVVHADELDAAAAPLAWPAPAVAHLHNRTRSDERLLPPWDPRRREALELWAGELAALRRHRHVIANSEQVAATLRGRGRDVTVVPLALDPDDYGAPATLAEPVAGLIGTAWWPPTERAVERLVGRVWPAVGAAVPDAELRIAGRGMSAERFGAAAAPGISWPGEVPSAAEFLRGLGVLLYPVASGSGTKVKVLEALALGVPVVTTAAGAEGLAPSEGVLVAEDDATLARHAARLLADRDERAARGHAARATFASGHTPAVVAERLGALYARVAGGRPAAGGRG